MGRRCNDGGRGASASVGPAHDLLDRAGKTGPIATFKATMRTARVALAFFMLTLAVPAHATKIPAPATSANAVRGLY